MQLEAKSPPRREDADAGRTDAGLAVRPQVSIAPVANAAESESDATLRLLKGCVEALSLLQAKCESLESELTLKIDIGDRERAELRTALASADTAVSIAAAWRQESEDRLVRVEAAAEDGAKRFAADLALARTEAANWRMRSETDTMAFEHLNTRLSTLETGLTVKLDRATRDLAEQESSNAQLRAHAESDQTKVSRLETQLRGVEATIADQRSRISCLQSKLATASYALRLDHLTRNFGDVDGLADRPILDLQDLARAV